MKSFAPALVAALLAVSTACDRSLAEARKTVYVPSEAGLTLIYENPTLPSDQRTQERLQVRVETSKDAAEGRRTQLSYTTLQGRFTTTFLSKDGGWAMMEGDKCLVRMLPEGFPDRVSHWEDRGTAFRVIGRAAVDLPGLKLPEDFNRIGVWVESETPQGARRRVLLLPGIGEGESLSLKNGQWVVVNQLVSRGFTDAPLSK